MTLRSFNCTALSDTQALAISLAEQTKSGDVITLRGDLGMGKTAFARAFIQALMGEDIDVPSPTFTLLNLYDAEHFPLYHADLYRLENPNDYWELGIEEGFDEGVTLIEWPEIIEKYLPESRLDVRFERPDADDLARTITYVPCGAWKKRVL